MEDISYDTVLLSLNFVVFLINVLSLMMHTYLSFSRFLAFTALTLSILKGTIFSLISKADNLCWSVKCFIDVLLAVKFLVAWLFLFYTDFFLAIYNFCLLKGTR